MCIRSLVNRQATHEIHSRPTPALQQAPDPARSRRTRTGKASQCKSVHGRGRRTGSPAGYYLSAAGVGTIAIIDDDEVDLSNLQRQIAHCTKTLGVPKVESAKNTFEALNPDVHVIPFNERLTKRTFSALSEITTSLLTAVTTLRHGF